MAQDNKDGTGMVTQFVQLDFRTMANLTWASLIAAAPSGRIANPKALKSARSFPRSATTTGAGSIPTMSGPLARARHRWSAARAALAAAAMIFGERLRSLEDDRG
jgi:hypothetical protein